MKKLFSVPFTITVMLLAGALSLAALSARRVSERLAAPLVSIDPRIDGWTSTGDQTFPAGTLHALNPTEYLARTYARGTSHIELFIAFYARQRAGESMHSPKHCLPGAGWEIWRQESALVPVGGRQVEVNKDSIENLGAKMLMFYWYQSKDRIFADEYLGKYLLARDTLLTGHTAGSIVRILVPDAPGASRAGIEFASSLIPEVQRCFGTKN